MSAATGPNRIDHSLLLGQLPPSCRFPVRCSLGVRRKQKCRQNMRDPAGTFFVRPAIEVITEKEKK
jgi:hypothetical protein